MAENSNSDLRECGVPAVEQAEAPVKGRKKKEE